MTKLLQRIVFAGTMLLLLTSLSTSGGTEVEAPRPRLTVVFIVDQMRADYLTRWSSQYFAGLHRLLSEGAVFRNAQHDHAATETAVGHATIATGAIPAHHGIVSNSFYDRSSKCEVYSVADCSVTIIGGCGGDGVSPRLLLRSTLGDWLKAASPNSKVFSASLKDRAAILMGGRKADGVYWYDGKTGDFVTSSFYATKLPDWVDAFNLSGAKDTWSDSAWTKARTDNAYQGDDRVLAEQGGQNSVFPHGLLSESDTAQSAYHEALWGTPFADVLLLKFCWDLLASEHLGQDSIPDLFMISLSAADVVGHGYGPDSHEIQDYYFRLDKELGLFLDTLDARMGNDGYVFVLASDHGVCPLPELAAARGIATARRLNGEELRRDVAKALHDAFPQCEHADSLLTYYGNCFMVDSAVASECSLSAPTVEKDAAASIERLDYVANVFTFEQLSSNDADDRPFAKLFRNSFLAARSTDLVINFKEGVVLTSYPSGTSHGTPYRYDTDVPVIFFGGGIPHGVDDNPVRSVDIAPTVAGLLRISPEAGVDGHALPVAR